jgi:hypothetical protein
MEPKKEEVYYYVLFKYIICTVTDPSGGFRVFLRCYD